MTRTETRTRFPLLHWILPALALLAVTLPSRFKDVVNEPDLALMSFGLIFGAQTGLPLDRLTHYGAEFSFGYYWLLNHLLSPQTLLHPDALLLAMNRFGWASGAALGFACSAYFVRLAGARAGAAVATIFLLCPGVLQVALSGHPVVPAMALMFAAAWVLLAVESDAGAAARLAAVVAGTALAWAALCMRADVVLAWPFLTLASARTRVFERAWWRGAIVRGVLLALALVGFLACQAAVLGRAEQAGNGLAEFVTAFLSWSNIPRGVVTVALSCGLVTLAALGLGLVFKPRLERGQWWPALVLVAALALPSLAFWLPNPKPARHFVFVFLAAAWLLGQLLARWPRGPAAWLAVLATIVVGNQLAAEAARVLIIPRHDWTYPQLVPRRSSVMLPLGLFPLEQRSNEDLSRMQREEARAVAAAAPQRLLFLGDERYYTMTELMGLDPSLRLRVWDFQGVPVRELHGGGRRLLFVEKLAAWPRDFAALALAAPEFAGLPIYVQPSTVSRYDQTPVPAGRAWAPGPAPGH